MTFLAPLAGIFASAIAVPALLALYFLKLRRRPLRVSSTFLWQQAAKDLQVNAPFRWLRPSWLLLLQLLALGALIAAIARPAITGGPDVGRRVLVLIDRSASMSATDAKGPDGERLSRLDEAKRRALEAVNALLDRPGAAPAITVAAFASGSAALTPGVQGRGALREAIESITPTDQPGDLSAAIAPARALAADGLSESAAQPLKVLLFSDGGFAPSDRPSGKGLSPRLERVGPSESHHANAGIVAMSARRDYDDPGTLRVFVRVLNAAKEARTVTLRLSIDSRLVEERPISLPAAAATSTGEELGEASVTFAVGGREGGVLLAQILEADALAADNTAGLVVSAAAPVRLLVVGPGPGGRDADRFLINVLGSMDEASLRLCDTETYEQLAAAVESSWAFDLVFFDRVSPSRAPRSPSVSFGSSPPGGLVKVEPNTDPLASARPVSWRREHPLLRYVNLDSVLIQPPMSLTVPAGPARFTDLADSASGPLMGVIEDSGGVRRVVVAFELARSNWPPNLSFPIFLQNAIDYLTLRAESAGGRATRTNQPVSVRAEPKSSRIELFAGPKAEGEPVLTSAVAPRADSPAATPMVSLGAVERVGLYTARGATTETSVVAVNLVDTQESSLRVANQLDLPGGTISASSGAAVSREIWSWFAVAALALLSVEWVIYARRMRNG